MTNLQDRRVLVEQNSEFDLRLARASAAAHDLGAEHLLSAGVEQIADALVFEHAARPVDPRWGTFELKLDEPRSSPVGDGGIRPLRVAFEMEFGGAVDATSGFWTNGHSDGQRTTRSYVFDMGHADNAEADTVRTWLDEARDWWFAQIRTAVEATNKTITSRREEMHAAVAKIVRSRQTRLRLLHDAAGALDIPLNRAPGDVVTVPLAPRALTLNALSEQVRNTGQTAGLSDSIADAIVQQIASFGTALERLPDSANRLAGSDEETLRDLLLFLLNANWEGRVTGETFVGQGKTDLHMDWEGRAAFIGECKFWKGESHFADALTQLLDRYTVWRATRVALVLFIRDRKDVSAVREKAWATIEKHPRFVGELTRAVGVGAGTRAAHMQAQSDERRLVQLEFIDVVIPARDPRAGSVSSAD